MIRAIIVDDEPLALEVLETYIERLPEVVLVTKCANAIEANEALKKHPVDLMFLDIQMPQLSGIDFLKSLSKPPLVIFTTAYPDYAVEGFDLNAVDYLLKPISFDRFLKAVNKISEKMSNSKANNHLNSQDNQDEFIFVKADKKLIKVNFDDVLYIEGLKDYVIIKLNNSRIITLQTMKSLEDKMPSSQFRRIHRSYIVNVDKIQAIVGNMVEIIEGNKTKQIPIGNNYKDDLLALVNDNRL